MEWSLAHTINTIRWTLVAFRLAFVSDVGAVAAGEGDAVGGLAALANEAVGTVGTDPDRLLRWLGRAQRQWKSALPRSRYQELSAKLHVADES